MTGMTKKALRFPGGFFFARPRIHPSLHGLRLCRNALDAADTKESTKESMRAGLILAIMPGSL
jgi:hypothetical protein